MKWLWDLDQAVQHAINVGLNSPITTEVMRFVTYLGLDQVVIPVIVILIACRYTRRVGWQAALAYIFAGTATMAVKVLCPRLRPGYPGEGAIVAPDESVYLSSFPSGHTAIAFALAFTVLLSFPGKRRLLVGVTAVGVALLVGISRVYRGIHWPTDVLGAIVIAWMAALVAWRLLNRGQAEALQHPEEEPA